MFVPDRPAAGGHVKAGGHVYGHFAPESKPACGGVGMLPDLSAAGRGCIRALGRGLGVVCIVYRSVGLYTHTSDQSKKKCQRMFHFKGGSPYDIDIAKEF